MRRHSMNPKEMQNAVMLSKLLPVADPFATLSVEVQVHIVRLRIMCAAWEHDAGVPRTKS